MNRSFRPSLENLESRDVFSLMGLSWPLADIASVGGATVAQPTAGNVASHDLQLAARNVSLFGGASVRFISQNREAHVAAGDFNTDGRLDLAAFDKTATAPNAYPPGGVIDNYIHDNFFMEASSDPSNSTAVFLIGSDGGVSDFAEPRGIIAILIGLVHANGDRGGQILTPGTMDFDSPISVAGGIVEGPLAVTHDPEFQPWANRSAILAASDEYFLRLGIRELSGAYVS